MTDLEHNDPPKTPTTPSEKSKFHFRFALGGHSHGSNTLKSGDIKPTDTLGNKMDKRTFSQEAQSVPDIQSLSSIASNDIDSLSHNILRLPLWDKASAEFCFAKSRELLTKPLNITSYSDLSEVSSFGCDMSSLHGTLTSLNKDSYYEDVIHGINDHLPKDSMNSKHLVYNSDEKNSDNDTLTKKSFKNVPGAKQLSHKKKFREREEIIQTPPSILDDGIISLDNTLKREKRAHLRSSLRGYPNSAKSEKEYNSKSSSFDLLDTIDRSLSKVGIFSSNKLKESPPSPQFNTKNASMTPKSVKSPNASFFLFPNVNDEIIDTEFDNVNSGYEHNLDVYSPRSLQNGVFFQDSANKQCQQYEFQGIRKSDSFSRKKTGVDSIQRHNNNIPKNVTKKTSNTYYEENSIYVQQIDGKKYVVAAPKNYGFDNKVIFSPGLHNSNTSIHSYQVQRTTVNQTNDYYDSRPRALSFSERNAMPNPSKANFPIQKVLSSKSIKARNLRRQSYNPGVYDVDTSSSDSDANLDYSISHSECDIRLIMNKTSSQSKHIRQSSCRRSSPKSSRNKISSKFSTSNSSIRSVPQNFMAASGNGHVSNGFMRDSKNNMGNYGEPFNAQYDHSNLGYGMRNKTKVSSKKARPSVDVTTYRSETHEFAEDLLRIKPKPVMGNHHLHPGYGSEASNFDVSKLTGKSPPPSQNFLNTPTSASPTLRNKTPNNRSGASTPCAFNWPEAISGSAVNANFTPSKNKDWYTVDRRTLERIEVTSSSSSSDSSNDSLTEYPDFKMDYSIGFPPSPAP